MVERYFEKFPVIKYSDKQVVDITRRITLLDSVSNSPYNFYPYELVDNERADQFSSRYYDDPYKSWLLYLTNKVVDPYYEWYLDEKQFAEFISEKYGSIEIAQNKVLYYVNNWSNSQDISISSYNALSYSRKKYWEPVYGVGSKIAGYTRKKINWKTNTNHVMRYKVANTNFKENEICTISFNNSQKGKGQFISSEGNNIFIQHVSGIYDTSVTVSITPQSYIYGHESGTNTVMTEVTKISDNISNDEELYWKSVTLYEEEYEKNEYNKTIRVLDKDYSQLAADNLKALMKE